MKKLKTILVMLILILGVMLVTNVNQAYAVTLKNDNTNYVLKTTGGNTIVTFRSIYDDPDKAKLGSIYCIRGSSIFISGTAVDYSQVDNMKTKANDVIKRYKDLYNVDLNRTETILDSKNNSYNTNIYNDILWIMDNLYLPKDNEKYIANTYRSELLNNIKNDTGNPDVLNVSDTELEMAQQAAIWFFTDYDTNGENSVSFNRRNIADYIYFNNSNDWTNQDAINSIYNYFIDNALANASKYGTTDPRGIVNTPPTIVKGTTLKEPQVQKNGTAYYIGPFKIDKTVDGNIDYTVTSQLKINETIVPAKANDVSTYTITSNTDEMDKYNTIEDAINKGEFYLRMPEIVARAYNLINASGKISNNVDLSLTCSYSYYETTETMWEPENGQAVVIIDKNKVEGGDTLNWTTEKPGEFTLKLNKKDADSGNSMANVSFTLYPVTKAETTFTRGTAIGTYTTTASDLELLKKAITSSGDYKPGETYYFELTETTPSGYLDLEVSIIIKVEIDSEYNITAKLVKITGDGQEEVNSIDAVGITEALKIECTNNVISLTVKNRKQNFDLALRKYITGLQSSEGTTKAIKNMDNEDNQRNLTSIDATPLTTTGTTAIYKHQKDPVLVETGDIVTYTLRVYNEGDIDGWVTEVRDILPEGLEFITPLANVNKEFVLEGTTPTTDAKYTYKIENGELTIKPISGKEADTVFDKLTAFDKNAETPELDYGTITFNCKVTATTSTTNKVLTNVARISADKADLENSDMADRDSQPETFTTPADLSGYKGDSNNKTDLKDTTYFYKGQQDDDDFEKLIILGEKFDLSLRKFITKINGQELEVSREPKLDMTPLEDTKASTTTANYIHSKEPIVVKQGDIVTYKIRVYNEGDRDGYVTNIADYLPEGLGFLPEYKANVNNNWALQPETTAVDLKTLDGICDVAKNNLKLEDFDTALTSLDNVKIVKGKTTITSNLLKEDLIKAYDSEKTSLNETENWQKAEEDKGTTGLYYQDVEVTCIVLAPNTCTDILKNIAEIIEAKDLNKNVCDDIDSEPDNVEENNYHNSTEDNGYWPGEQDDDDYEPVILQCFDLALRKFITGVNDKPVTTRVPQLSIDETTGNIKYTHPKEEAPVEVANSDVVTYTLRIFNEGTKAGYADLITDDIPEGLEFLPADKTNKEYRWVMYTELDETEDATNAEENDKEQNAEDINNSEEVEEKEIIIIDGKKYVETDDASQADMIQTDYLSKAQGEARMQKDTSLTENPALLNAFDASKALEEGNPDYADVKVAFKVVEENTSDRIVVNSAQISHDTDKDGNEVTDEDSETNKWNDGEDDQDKEYIKVKYFDLSLYKWVTKSIVTVDGKTTTTETGFKPNIGKTENITGIEIRPNTENEPIAAVTLDKKKLNKTTVKFVYSIMVMNEGEIPGYATEVTDYIPEGLEFVDGDNTGYGWTQDGDKKVTTRFLESKLLNPGESTTLEIVFNWKNSADNLGLKTNIAEISEDYNDSDSKDIDSTPDNKKDEYKEEQEDDDDFALVILTLKTGSAPTYIALATGVLAIIAGGTILIKKYVL